MQDSQTTRLFAIAFGSVLCTLTCFSLLIIAALITFEWDSLTMTGWIVLVLILCCHLVALQNAVEVLKGTIWRWMPWLTWSVGAVSILMLSGLVLPHNFPMIVSNDPAIEGG